MADEVKPTREEKQAIDALAKLNKTWPQSLKVQIAGASITVFKKDKDNEFLSTQVAQMENKLSC
jgi:hypothetical protein